MACILLHHLSGSRAAEIDVVPLAPSEAIVLGRDPAATVRFHATRDLLAGRRHACIACGGQGEPRHELRDLAARNGTFLNRQRVLGALPLRPGDVLQLGAGGPALRFDVVWSRSASPDVATD